MDCDVARAASSSPPSNRSKQLSLVSFLVAILLLIWVLLPSSNLSIYRPHLQCLKHLHGLFPSSEWDRKLFDALQYENQRKKAEASLQSCAAGRSIENESYDDFSRNAMNQRATTSYEIHFTLCGDDEEFSKKQRSAFLWITTQAMDDLEHLHDADIVQVKVYRRELQVPFGLLPYYRRETFMRGNNDVAEATETSQIDESDAAQYAGDAGQNRSTRDSYYISDSDVRVGRVPLGDILSESSHVTSECAADPGCLAIQMILYVPPTQSQPLQFIDFKQSQQHQSKRQQSDNEKAKLSGILAQQSETQHKSASGILFKSKSSVIIANMNEDEEDKEKSLLESIVNITKSHLRDIIGLPESPYETIGVTSCVGHSDNFDIQWAESPGVSPYDISHDRASRISSLYSMAVRLLSAYKALYETETSDLVPFQIDIASKEKYVLAVKHLEAFQQILLSNETYAIFDGNNRMSQSDEGEGDGTMSVSNISTAPLETMHYHCYQAVRLSYQLSIDPNLLPDPFFPLDQQLVMYAPYWIPILVPLAKGCYTLFASFLWKGVS